MRNAYVHWENAFMNSGLETTPAYDVVGLFAALTHRHGVINPRLASETHFDITRGDLSQEGCDVYRLKQKYRTKESLSALFLHQFKLQKFKLLIITDFGEECDDETACLLANSLVFYGVDVRFLFTTARFAEQKNRFHTWNGNPELVTSIHEDNDVITWFNTEQQDNAARPIILQIGPIHEPRRPGGWRHMWRPNITCDYDYVVVGTFNSPAALNVKANARDAALHLKNKATEAIVVDTMGGLGAFKFSATELRALGFQSDILQHVCKIGWRNSVGRANPAGGNYVVHLVSEPVGDFQGGANYMTALGIDKTLGKNIVERERGARAISIATKYLEQLTEARGPANLSIEDSGELTKIAGRGEKVVLPVTRDSVINGYAFILDCLNEYFQVPIEFFESGRPEAWKQQWETPSLRDKGVVERFEIVPSMRIES